MTFSIFLEIFFRKHDIRTPHSDTIIVCHGKVVKFFLKKFFLPYAMAIFHLFHKGLQGLNF